MQRSRDSSISFHRGGKLPRDDSINNRRSLFGSGLPMLEAKPINLAKNPTNRTKQRFAQS
jgi:hypothetical protein